MKLLHNLTLHAQGEPERRLALEQGLELTREPEGVTVARGQVGLASASRQLADQLRHCASGGDGALVGGHTGPILAAVFTLTQNRERIPELYYFDTRRVRDENGRFVFVPEGLVRIVSG